MGSPLLDRDAIARFCRSLDDHFDWLEAIDRLRRDLSLTTKELPLIESPKAANWGPIGVTTGLGLEATTDEKGALGWQLKALRVPQKSQTAALEALAYAPDVSVRLVGTVQPIEALIALEKSKNKHAITAQVCLTVAALSYLGPRLKPASPGWLVSGLKDKYWVSHHRLERGALASVRLLERISE